MNAARLVKISPLRVVLLSIFVALLMVGAQPVLGQQGAARQRSTTELGTLPGTDYSLGSAINDPGQVAGNSVDPHQLIGVHGFLWEKGRMIDLGSLVPNGVLAASQANDINNRGQVVGNSTFPLSSGTVLWPRAFLWERGRMIDLGALPGRGLRGSWANGINNRGQVVGSSAGRAFLWEKDRMKNLGTLPGRDFSWANDINDRGQVVGYSSSEDAAEHAFLWEKDRMIDLGTLPGGGFSEAIGINDRGQVVGVSTTDSNTVHAFLWEKGRMTDLGTLPGVDLSVALAINDRGQVVGYGLEPEVVKDRVSGGSREVYVEHAFLWEDGRMTDLGRQSGELFSVASDINNRGQVAGTSASEALVILRCCNIVLLWDWHAVLWSKGSPGPGSRSTYSARSQSIEGSGTTPPFGMRATSGHSVQQKLLRQGFYPDPMGPGAAVGTPHPGRIMVLGK